MSQRLAELQHQRALLHEHLAWLEREIAAEKLRPTGAAAGTESTASPAPTRVTAATTRLTSATAPDATRASAADSTFATSVNLATAASSSDPAPPAREAEAILEQYRMAPDAVRKDVRQGCFLYFALAFLLLGIGLSALYVMFRL